MTEEPQPTEVNAPVESEVPDKIRIHYIKSNAFRTIHADGVFGGITPRSYLSATFYNERAPLPDQSVHRIQNGRLSDEIPEERITRDGILRELEANIVFDVAFAKNLVKWLNEKISLLEERSAGHSTQTQQSETDAN